MTININRYLTLLYLFILLISIGIYEAKAMPPVPTFGINDIVFSHDSSKILIKSDKDTDFSKPENNQIIKFLDVKTGQVVRSTPITIKQSESSMGFTADGNKLTVGKANKISILHNQTGKVLRELPTLSTFTPSYIPFKAIVNASGSQQLFHQIEHNKAQLYSLHTGSGKVLKSIPLPKEVSRSIGSLVLTAMGLSPDGKKVTYITTPRGSRKNTLYIYDVYKQNIAKEIPLPDVIFSPVQPMVFSSDGRSVALAGSPSMIVNLESDEVLSIKLFSENVVFLANNKKLVLLPYSNQLVVFDLASGKKNSIALPIKSHCRAANYAGSLNKRYIALGIRCSGQYKKGTPDSVLLLDANSLKLIRTYSVASHSNENR